MKIEQRTKWWLGFTLSTALPVWGIGSLYYFGGHVFGTISYSAYQWMCFLIWISSLYFMMKFLRMPERLFGLRFATGFVLGILMLMGSCSSMFGPTCPPDTIALGRTDIFSGRAQGALAKGDCETIHAAQAMPVH